MVLQRGGERHDPLRGLRAGHRLEPAPRHLADRDLVLVGQVDDVVEDRRRVQVSGEDHLSRSSGPGQEKFADSLTALDLVTAEALGGLGRPSPNRCRTALAATP